MLHMVINNVQCYTRLYMIPAYSSGLNSCDPVSHSFPHFSRPQSWVRNCTCYLHSTRRSPWSATQTPLFSSDKDVTTTPCKTDNSESVLHNSVEFKNVCWRFTNMFLTLRNTLDFNIKTPQFVCRYKSVCLHLLLVVIDWLISINIHF
jgi:hypothetical protein